MLVEQLPQDSATYRSVFGRAAEWSTTDHLLATLVDLLAWANYQRAGGKGPRPKPLVRPGDTDPDETRFGGTTLPLHEARRRIDRLHGRHPRPRTDDERRQFLAALDAAPTATARARVRRQYRIPHRSSAPSRWRRALGLGPAPPLARR